MKKALLIGVLALGGSCAPLPVPCETDAADAILESARTLPLERDVDVLVLGGGLEAVRAALAARAEGVRVFLAAPRPYLGEDRAGTLRLQPPADFAFPFERKLWTYKGKVRTLVRPHELKSALDRALLAADVDFLTGLLPTDELTDAAGRVSGAILAGKSGRAAVRAKAVVNCAQPAPSGETAFGRIVVSRDRPSGTGLVVEPLPGKFRTSVGGYKQKGPAYNSSVWLCRLALSVKPGDWSSLAAAEQRARDLTWTPGEFDAADSIFRLDEPAFAGVEEGRRAAAAAKARGPVGEVKVARRATGTASAYAGFEVREPAHGFRPFDRGLPRVEVPAQALPVLGHYDTVVVGGGTAGAPAAIAAARQGAKTLVVECLYGLGGMSTVGQIGTYWFGNICGFTTELEAGVKGLGAIMYIRGKEEWLRRECRRAGAEIWYGAAGCGAVTKDGKVAGVVVVTPYGRGVVLAKGVVDATGDAAVVAAAGGATEYLGTGELALQGTGLATRRLGRSFNNTDWGLANDGDATDAWLFSLRTRLGGPQNQSGDRSQPWDFAQLIGSRERRRIRSVYEVTPADILTARTFPDTVVCARSNFDSHGSTVDPLCFVSERIDGNHRRAYWANVPYRAIVPAKLDGVVAVGLGMGVQRDALPILRMQADQHNLGYAAGLAAAQVAKSGREFREADVAALQRELAKRGVIPEAALSWTDSWPVADVRWREAVANCGDDYHDIAVVLSRPDEAVPALCGAYASETNARRRLVYASILGVLGCPAGAQTLVDWFEGRGPAFEICFRPGQQHRPVDKWPLGYGRRLSDRETLLVALGRTRDPAARPVLEAELGKLTAQSTPEAVRAAVLAADGYARSELAAALEDVLARPGFSGHSVKRAADLPPGGGYGALPEVDACGRELALAHALLACGDPHGKARAVFRAYADDPRGVYALYAREVLTGYKGS